MKAKPFIKWVGGKGQLIKQLDAQLPADFGNWEDVTYIEPFVGGGASVNKKGLFNEPFGKFLIDFAYIQEILHTFAA